jgi:hypothetical protein
MATAGVDMPHETHQRLFERASKSDQRCEATPSPKLHIVVPKARVARDWAEGGAGRLFGILPSTFFFYLVDHRTTKAGTDAATTATPIVAKLQGLGV